MQVSRAQMSALLAAATSSDVAEFITDNFSVATAPAAGQLYVTPSGQRRLLVVTTDGQEAVVNPDTGRLLAHGRRGAREVFTSWAERIEQDSYTLID